MKHLARFAFVACLAIGAEFAAYAADAPATPQSAIVPVTLSPADLNALVGALSKLPYEQAAPIVNFLTTKEVEAQRAHAPPTKP